MMSVSKLAALSLMLILVYQKGYLQVVLQTALLIVGGFLGLLLFKQNEILYLPQPDRSIPKENLSDPQEYAGMPFTEIKLRTDDGVNLHGWFIKQSEDSPSVNRKATTVLYFHGNAGNISNRLPYFHEMWEQLGVNIIAVEYRGFGESEGTPTEEGLQMDAEAFLEYAQNHELVDHEKLVVFGRSLGGAVAIHLASTAYRRGVKGVIVENTFLSVPDIAFQIYPILRVVAPILKKPIMKNVWNSKEHIKRIRCPILFISGQKDELIPEEHMKTLYRVCPHVSGTRFCAVPEGGHNDTPFRAGDEYYDFIQQFLDEISSEHLVPASPRDSRISSLDSVDTHMTEVFKGIVCFSCV